MLRNKIVQASLLWLVCIAGAQAVDPQKQVAPIDEIVVLVNDDVITRHELDERVEMVTRQLKKQGTALPEASILEKQILERMITERLQSQFAKETGLRIDDTQLDRALNRIAQQNGIATLSEFRGRLEKDGVEFDKFREEIRAEIATSRLREREVDSKLVISDNEADSFIANQEKQTGQGVEYHLAHIFIVVPEQASADVIRTSKKRADDALAQLYGGAEFAQVAAGFSDAKDALTGGDLGWRPADRIAMLFLDELKKMKPGAVSPILRSPNGFHIVKLIEKRSKDVPILISQTHVRHILIKTSELVPEKVARDRLLAIKRAIDNGANFAEQARSFSEDGSAAQGGDLGWISPGDTVPEFEAGMNALQVGQISDAVQSGFGWHLIQVTERRDTDMSIEQKRQQARQAIRSMKSDENWQDWLRQLRDRAYIEYRIEQAN
ncbi:MAG: peptidylprolyl isomerase [Nitrosomonadales bacterium]|nr:peptidylprolyl isomerase [Nitrosomonadales bacterium]